MADSDIIVSLHLVISFISMTRTFSNKVLLIKFELMKIPWWKSHLIVSVVSWSQILVPLTSHHVDPFGSTKQISPGTFLKILWHQSKNSQLFHLFNLHVLTPPFVHIHSFSTFSIYHCIKQYRNMCKYPVSALINHYRIGLKCGCFIQPNCTKLVAAVGSLSCTLPRGVPE
jgi:hypothetical protein